MKEHMSASRRRLDIDVDVPVHVAMDGTLKKNGDIVKFKLNYLILVRIILYNF